MLCKGLLLVTSDAARETRHGLFTQVQFLASGALCASPPPPLLFLDQTEAEILGGGRPLSYLRVLLIPPPTPPISRSGSGTATIRFSSVFMVTGNFPKSTHFFHTCADRTSMSNHCCRFFL